MCHPAIKEVKWPGGENYVLNTIFVQRSSPSRSQWKMRHVQFAQKRYNGPEPALQRVKKTALLPPAGIALLALLGATIVVAIVTVIVAALPIFAQGPEDILPEKETVAVFFRPTEVQMRRLEPWLPMLAQWTTDAPQVLAIVDLPRGGQGSVAFIRRQSGVSKPLPSPDAFTHEVGPYYIRVSSPELWPLLAESSARLDRSKPFRILSQNKTGDRPWVFLARRVLPHPVFAGDLIFQNLVFAEAEAVSIVATASGSVTTEVFAQHALWDDLPTLSSAVLPPRGHFAFSVGLPTTCLSQMLASLPRAEHAIAESLLLTWIQDIFGEDVSMETDLLPLVSREGSLSLARTASGGLSFLLQGEGKEADSSLLLTRLHNSVRAELSTARISQHILDKGRFINRNLRNDTSLIRETERDAGPWHIRTTTHAGDGLGLVSALNGYRVFLSNDEGTLVQALNATGASFPAFTSAAGTMELAIIPGLPGFLHPPSPLLPDRMTQLDWTLSRRGSVTTIVFSKGKE